MADGKVIAEANCTTEQQMHAAQTAGDRCTSLLLSICHHTEVPLTMDLVQLSSVKIRDGTTASPNSHRVTVQDRAVDTGMSGISSWMVQQRLAKRSVCLHGKAPPLLSSHALLGLLMAIRFIGVTQLNDVDTLVFFESGGSINYIIDSTPLGNSSSAATCKNAEKNEVPNTPLDSINVMHGSKLAVVGTSDLGKAVLFYQDRQGYLCYRTAEGLIWDDVPVRLCKAAKGTGIAALGWSGLKHIRVYYQDEGYTVQEYCGVFGGDWTKGATIADEVTSLTNLSAVHWFHPTQGSEIRMYYQKGDRIAEKCWGVQAHKWSPGPTLFSGLPVNSSINAFIRDLKADWPVLSLWAATQGKDLHQRVYYHGNGWGGDDHYKLPRSPE
ncbi:hypothetical protein BC835DRAFT_1518193 [Cytidiella melzeri]|nr:hypothetical protein BC835DRAFT_1518193 [Cytidiella melzeri]